MENKIKLGLFGGTFDPVHNGHIYIALEAQEFYDLDEVHWGVTAQKKKTMCGVQWRRQRVYKVSKSFGHKLSPYVYKYSIDWVKQYNPNKYEVHLIVGPDLAKQMGEWKNIGELTEICKFAWVDRFLPISSTMIRDRIRNNQHIGAFIP